MSRIAEPEVLDLLARLVGKSLVVYEEGNGRYRLLETVRQYARDRLRESGEGEVVRARHRDHFVSLSDDAREQLTGPSQGEWLDRLEADHENLRAVLEFCAEEPASGEAGLRLVGSVWRFWETRGHYGEGRERCRIALSHVGAQAPGEARALALYGAGFLAYRQSDYPAADAPLQESLRISRSLEHRPGIARALSALGNVAAGPREYTLGRGMLDEALALHRELGDRRGEAMSLNNLGVIAELQGDDTAARSFYAQARTLIASLGDRAGLTLVLGNLGRIATRQGDLAQARSLLAESLVIERALKDRRGAAGDLQDLAGVEIQEAHYVRAARLMGAAALLREQIAAPPEFTGQDDIDRHLLVLRETLPADELAAALAAGRAMDWEQAIAYALGEADG